MASTAGSSMKNRRCGPIRSAIPRSCGASRMRASRSFQSSASTQWRTPRSRGAALASRWRSPKTFAASGDSWIFGPEAPYEREGDVGNVAFPCGYTVGADGDAINLYYGGADSCVALATGSIRQLLSWLDEHGTAS